MARIHPTVIEKVVDTFIQDDAYLHLEDIGMDPGLVEELIGDIKEDMRRTLKRVRYDPGPGW